MGLQESRSKIASSVRDLMHQWASTRVDWNDENAQWFEETFLIPLDKDVRSSANAMDEMSSLLIQLRQQCQ